MRNRERRLNNKHSLTTEPIKIKRKYQKHMMENRVKFEILCFLVTLIEFFEIFNQHLYQAEHIKHTSDMMRQESVLLTRETDQLRGTWFFDGAFHQKFVQFCDSRTQNWTNCKFDQISIWNASSKNYQSKFLRTERIVREGIWRCRIWLRIRVGFRYTSSHIMHQDWRNDHWTTQKLFKKTGFHSTFLRFGCSELP